MLIQFPIKHKLEVPVEIEKRLDLFAEEYMELLKDALDQMLSEDHTYEEASKAMEMVLERLLVAFNAVLEKELE